MVLLQVVMHCEHDLSQFGSCSGVVPCNLVSVCSCLRYCFFTGLHQVQVPIRQATSQLVEN
jgi:hypothetical protein